MMGAETGVDHCELPRLGVKEAPITTGAVQRKPLRVLVVRPFLAPRRLIRRRAELRRGPDAALAVHHGAVGAGRIGAGPVRAAGGFPGWAYAAVIFERSVIVGICNIAGSLVTGSSIARWSVAISAP